MNKNKPISNTTHWTEKLQDHPFFYWSVLHWRGFFYVFLLIIALATVGLSFSSRRATQAESSYLLAENYLHILQKNIPDETLNPSSTAEGTLTKLEKIIQDYPELHPKYDGAIAQFLLLKNEEKKASALTKNILERVQPDQLPSYAHFTEISLLISEGQYEEALHQSEILQKTFLDLESSKHSFNYLFFAYNLLRIALLHKQMGHKEEELAAWKKWEKYSIADEENKQAVTQYFMILKEFFKEGNFSLDQYIKERKEALNFNL